MGRVVRWLIVGLVALIVLLTVSAALYDATSAHVVATPPLDAHGHVVQTGDIMTHYEQWGTQGPVLVLVPGFLESSFVWKRVGPALGRDFRVYALDVRGFGYTTHRPPYTLATDTAQLGAFLTALHLDAAHGSKPVLIGHSTGVAIVASLALLHPDAVAGVVLSDGDGTNAGTGPDWAHRMVVDPYFTAVVRLVVSHPVLMRAIWQTDCGPGCPSLTGAELEGWRRPLEVAGAEGALKAMAQAPTIGLSPAQLSALRVPAAIVRGVGDDVMPADDAATAAGWVKARMVVSVPKSRHLPMISNPTAYVRDLQAMVSCVRSGHCPARTS
jgi:pimeloyl-ACP methyl ester carboxylesterase